MHCYIALHAQCLLPLLGCNVFKCNECNCIALHPRCLLQCTMYLYMMHCIASAMHPRCLLLQLLGCGAALYFLHATCHGHHPPPLDIVERLNFSFHTFMPRPLSTIPKHPKKILNFVCHLASAQKLYLQDKVNTNSAKL